MKNYILRDENAVFFECEYSCDNEIFICIDGYKFFITDARYAIEAQEFAKPDVNVICTQTSVIKEARFLLRKLKPKNLVFDPFDFSYADFNQLSSSLGIHFIQKPNFSKLKRIIKSQEEIQILQQAAKFGEKCFDEFADFIRKNGENMSEEELFFNANLIFRQKNTLGLSFEPIVAINENAAKAHALPSKKKLQYGDLLLVDAGVRYKKYCSDRTRTACFDENFNFSKEQKFKNQKQQDVYEIVKQAQIKAINIIKPSIKAKEIDLAARNFIAKAGYEKEFFHSTGHGVGIDIHEFPNINKRSETIIQEGMIFSVEPGIYIQNEFGVRIEDVVLVTKDGALIL
ncbi:M24 family metallopeptidase [Campylobacter pinnipediorum]|uniref:M24 family metallopeptidase n=1 Tax=Campylobacter pinnipediorum TaxID=1965231 RepID=UPI00084DF7F2|nr:M24 family metallopeptidase [Campylobacter pinnipediorum]